MNDERFIEMLNLYIDQELVGEEIHEIEEAIANSAERQRIYAQYCKIERASQVVFTEAEVPQPKMADLLARAQAEPGEVVEFSPAPKARPSWMAWSGAAAGLAAACFGIVAYLGSPGEVAKDSIAQSTTDAPAAPQLNQGDEDAYETVFVLNQRDPEGRVPGMRGVDNSFAWMTQLQFEPIERKNLDSWKMPEASPLEVRRLNAKWITPAGMRDSDEPAAMTAFQFQR